MFSEQNTFNGFGCLFKIHKMIMYIRYTYLYKVLLFNFLLTYLCIFIYFNEIVSFAQNLGNYE